MRVTETFISIQGEGPNTGQPAFFLRLAGCNLACSWCDSPYSWKKGEITFTDLDIMDIAAEINRSGVRVLVITGGEPLLYQDDIVRLISLVDVNIFIEIETNGTIKPQEGLGLQIGRFNVSPKLASSGNPKEKLDMTTLPSFYNQDTSKAPIFKFVISSLQDFIEVDKLVQEHGLEARDIWLMPEGTTRDTQLNNMEYIVNECISRGYNFCSRLHVLIWNDKLGV